jgi:hypothetical protein
LPTRSNSDAKEPINIFAQKFTPLMNRARDCGRLYADILQRVFNASARQRLKLVNNEEQQR